jgi:drug/metabolite transporter (DMT)-like permease
MRDIIRHRGGVAPLIAASVVFALWNTAYKYAVDGLPVAVALSVMLLTAAAALWAFALLRGRQRLTRRQLRRIALAGAVDPALSYAAIGVGLSHIDATVSAMLDGTEACFVVAFGALIARRAPGSRAVLGVLISAAGVTALGGARSLLGIGPWELLVLGGVACAGLCNVLSERVLGDDVDPVTMTAYQMSFAALATLPLLAWQWRAPGGIGGPVAHPSAWPAAVACGIALAAGFLLYNYAIVRVPVATAGMVLNTLPVFGVAAAIAFLGERITWAQVAGAAVILVAFFLFEEGGGYISIGSRGAGRTGGAGRLPPSPPAGVLAGEPAEIAGITGTAGIPGTSGAASDGEPDLRTSGMTTRSTSARSVGVVARAPPPARAARVTYWVTSPVQSGSVSTCASSTDNGTTTSTASCSTI